MRKILAILGCLGLLSGCVSVPPPIIQTEAMQTEESFMLILPQPRKSKVTAGNFDVSSLLEKISTNDYKKRYDPVKSRDWEVLGWNLSNDDCFVEKYRAFFFDSGGIGEKQGVKYSCEVIPVNKNKIKIVFKKITREQGHYVLSGKLVNQGLKFGSTDLKSLIDKFTYNVSFDVNSEFNSESVYSNFERNLNVVQYAHGGRKDPVTGKIFSKKFWVPSSYGDIPIHIETFPYRNGSKVIVYAEIPADTSEGNIDFNKVYLELVKSIAEVVNS